MSPTFRFWCSCSHFLWGQTSWKEHLNVNNEDSSDINSDFNGNEVWECRLPSTVDKFPDSNFEYQFCFVDDDDTDHNCDDETESTSDQVIGIGNRVDSEVVNMDKIQVIGGGENVTVGTVDTVWVTTVP